MTAPRLRATSVPIDDPGDLSELVPRLDIEHAWIRGGDGMIGVGHAARTYVESISAAERWWQEASADLPAPEDAGRGGVAFGSFVFDPRSTAQRSLLVVPELVIGRRAGKAWLTAITADGSEPVPRWPADRPAPRPFGEIAWADGSLSGPRWEHIVREAIERIDTGVLDKVVLARSVIASTPVPIDARRLVARLAAEYRRCWTFLVDDLVGASPEMLVRREGGLATSRVLAGTIRRTGDEQQDLALAAGLSRSSKDLAEHEYAVASVAAALSPSCSGMNVPERPYVLELPNVLHLATDVTAVAHRDTTAIALAAALHPSAAVCGTPTEAARALIAELENLDRGRYSGPVGWVDAAGDGEWAIALRCAQLTDQHSLRVFAGCGIVADSDPAAELAESVAKLVPIRDALG